MTQDEKRICAERLFDEIGLIDDRFIYEAATPYAPRKSFRALRAVLIAAVSVTLAVSITVGLFAVGMMMGGKKKGDLAEGDVDGFKDNISHSTGGSATLSVMLGDMKNETEELKMEKTDIELFGGSPMVIWKYSDEEDYRVKDITESELEGLTSRLSEDSGDRVAGGAPSGGLDGVWIAVGDGRVVSPYLEQTSGNTGYGEIFEYEPEYEPSEDFSAYLCDVIS